MWSSLKLFLMASVFKQNIFSTIFKSTNNSDFKFDHLPVNEETGTEQVTKVND